MPIYEYKCERCGKVSEIIAGASTKPTMLECPKCVGRMMPVPSVTAWRPDKTVA